MFAKLFLIIDFAIGSLALLEQVVPTDKIELTSSIDNIIDPNTPLEVTCKFKPSDHPNVDKLLSLKLSRKPFEADLFEPLVTVTARGIQKGVNFTGVANGTVLNDGGSDSSLKAEYAQVTRALAGVYKCEAVGLDKVGLVAGSEKNLIIGPKDMTSIQKCIETSPRQSLTVLKESLMACGAFEGDWFEILRDVTDLDVEDPHDVTPIFNSSSFYIINVYSSFENALEVCKKYNGYLAEINSEEELLFLDKHVSEYRYNNPRRGTDGRRRFLTGVYFNRPEARFTTYTHPNAPMYLGHWADGHPKIVYPLQIWVTLLTSYYHDVKMFVDHKESKDFIDDYLCEVSKDIQ